MAIHTGRFRIIFLIQDRFMDVLMAIVTFYSYLPETPLVILLMTGKTGGCQVCSVQIETDFHYAFRW